MSSVTSFTVYHKNPEAREVLGLGFVVGKVEQRTSYQYSGILPSSTPENQIPSVITEEKIVIKYEVLWDNQRHISPSLHLSTDLEWFMLTDDFLAPQADDDSDTDEDNEGQTEDETQKFGEDDIPVTNYIDVSKNEVEKTNTLDN